LTFLLIAEDALEGLLRPSVLLGRNGGMAALAPVRHSRCRISSSLPYGIRRALRRGPHVVTMGRIPSHIDQLANTRPVTR
jgi:hypothetical protein